MLTNYIKLAWRVLSRNKFFTFITLFGISFTLGILMYILSFLQSELGTNEPLTHKDKMVVLNQLTLRQVIRDTVYTMDTTMMNGVTVIDSTMKVEDRGSRISNTSMNNGIGEDFLSKLPSAETSTVFNFGALHDVYVNGVKTTISTLYGDAKYWDVFDHKMIEGRAYDQQEFEAAAKVICISDKTARSYFGTDENIIGREILIDGKNLKVLGMYKYLGKFVPYVCTDVVIPYSILDETIQDSYYHGFYSVVFKLKPNVSADNLKNEILDAATIIPLDHPSMPEGFNEIVFDPLTYNEMFANAIYPDRQDKTKGLRVMRWVMIMLLLFFILLPTLNLINLNVSRIMERSSEIGVRKAFGAHQGNILMQFVIENILQTFLGGILGLGLALLLINIVNSGGYLGDAVLILSPKFFIYSFLATLLFGVLSGLLPAYKMSKLQIVHALKENKL